MYYFLRWAWASPHVQSFSSEHHQKLLAPAASTEASLRLFLQLLLAWVAAGAQYRVSQQIPDTENSPNQDLPNFSELVLLHFYYCTVRYFMVKRGISAVIKTRWKVTSIQLTKWPKISWFQLIFLHGKWVNFSWKSKKEKKLISADILARKTS